MNTRKIEITEPTGIRSGDQHYLEGEIRVVEETLAVRFISLGWARDAATGETGERKPGAPGIVQPD